MIRRVIPLRFAIVFILFLHWQFEGKSQSTLTKIREWKTKEIENVSVDRIGNFFLVYKKGGIRKYDPDGKVMATLSKSKPTLLEPWYHPSIFIYERQTQKYFLYGRFFENAKEHIVAPEFAIEPYLVCPTHDNRLWILDKIDNSLKKVNPLTHEVINEFTFDTIFTTPQFHYLCEYQNLLFLKEKNAIWIVNNMGKVINKIESNQLGNFGFFGQELYYLEKNKIHFINLLTEDRYEIALEGDVQFAVVTDERIMSVSKNKISLYHYVPE